MRELNIKQIAYESDGWKRLLGFLIEENIHMKNRLSEVLKNGFHNNSMEELELFQNNFIEEDEVFGTLKREVDELDKLLVREIVEDGKFEKKTEKRIKKLRNKINTVHTKFDKIKLNFNTYLSENN